MHRKGGRPRTTWIKDHGVFLLELNPGGATKPAQWLCRACDNMGSPQLFQVTASTSAILHLREYMSILYLKALLTVLGSIGSFRAIPRPPTSLTITNLSSTFRWQPQSAPGSSP
ncbi:transposase-like protein [Verticillium dahliae]